MFEFHCLETDVDMVFELYGVHLCNMECTCSNCFDEIKKYPL